jgi:ribosomal protein S18 acetylase RimI-like enzyme
MRLWYPSLNGSRSGPIAKTTGPRSKPSSTSSKATSSSWTRWGEPGDSLGYGTEQIARTLQAVANHGRFLVAERGVELAGFVVGIVLGTTPDDELEVVPTTRGRIEELYVHSQHRGAGIGRALMAQIEAWPRSEPCDVINVEVFAPNERARRFYERFGYIARDIDYVKVL